MIDEYVQQALMMLASDYKDPTYTVTISSLETGEECDHDTLTMEIKQYNPSIYDLLKAFYIDIMELSPTTEQDLMDINNEAAHVVDMFLDPNNDNVTYNNRKLILRSGLEYDNNQKMYRSVLYADLIDSLLGSEIKEKTVITANETDVFVFNQGEDILIPLYLKTDYNQPLEQQILMITLMNHQKQNILKNKIILVTNNSGHALYYPTALPTEEDRLDYNAGKDGVYYNLNSYFYNDGVPRYLYYIKVDYLGTENYEPFSKEFKIYIEKGSKTDGGF